MANHTTKNLLPDELVEQQVLLNLSLYSQDIVKQYGEYGLDFMNYLSESNCWLPLFAAVDIVASFFSSIDGCFPIQTLPDIKNKNFKELYLDYYHYIENITNTSSFKKTGFFLNELANDSNDKEIKKQMYQGFKFLLYEIALKCPFAKFRQPTHSNFPSTFKWKDIYLKDCKEQIDDNIEKIYGLYQSDSADKNKNKRFSLEKSNKNRLLLDVTFQVFQKKSVQLNEAIKKYQTDKEEIDDDTKRLILQHEQEYQHSLSEVQNNIDYKLFDLYQLFYNKFEPSEELKNKIAHLQRITRTAVQKNPAYNKIEKTDNSGFINLTYVGLLKHNPKLFYKKFSELEHIFLGNDDKIKEHHEITVRFFIIEDYQSLIEKVVKENGYYRYSHVNIHKLISLLITHDLTRYLGRFPRLEIWAQFVTYRGNNAGESEKNDHSTNPIHLKSIKQKYKMNEGFMVKHNEIQQKLLLEPNLMESCPMDFDVEFFNSFFKHTETADRSFKKGNLNFDLFFGRGGAFLSGNDYPSKLNKDLQEIMNSDQEKYHPSAGIKKILQNNTYRTCPNHSGSFVFETNHRYLLANNDSNMFKPQVVSNILEDFLINTREFLLNRITEETINIISRRNNSHYK